MDSIKESSLFIAIIVICYFVGKIILYIKEKNKCRTRLEKAIKKQKLAVRKVEYYRDTFDKYPIACVCFILNRRNYQDMLMSLLMSLIDKGYLLTNDDNDVVVNEKADFSKLYRHEIFFLNNYKLLLSNKKFKDDILDVKYSKKQLDSFNINKNDYLFSDVCFHDFLFILLKDTIDLGLIEFCKNDRKKHFLGIDFVCIIYLIIYFSCVIYNNYNNFITVFIFFSIVCVFGPCMTYLLIWDYRPYNKYIVTPNGQELLNNLLGLENFFNHFSNINDIDNEQFILWKSYIYYAIIFDNSGLLNNSVRNSYLKLQKKYSNKNYIRSKKLFIFSFVLLLLLLVLYFILNLYLKK